MAGAKRGFAGMDPQKQRDIARKGGRAAHRKGTAHQWTSEEARIAGEKGGRAGQGTAANQQAEISSTDEELGMDENDLPS